MDELPRTTVRQANLNALLAEYSRIPAIASAIPFGCTTSSYQCSGLLITVIVSILRGAISQRLSGIRDFEYPYDVTSSMFTTAAIEIPSTGVSQNPVRESCRDRRPGWPTYGVVRRSTSNHACFPRGAHVLPPPAESLGAHPEGKGDYPRHPLGVHADGDLGLVGSCGIWNSAVRGGSVNLLPGFLPTVTLLRDRGTVGL